MKGLKGKNVLVTGGASGIGQATASRFIAEHCHVCILDCSHAARTRVNRELPELAALFAFLASDESAFVTGTALVVDGGGVAG